jgi:hypothetical protein
MWFVRRGAGSRFSRVFFSVDAIKGEVYEAAVRARATASTGSEATLTLANLWLKTCEENHSCGSSAKARWYPTRLPDISTDTVRLIQAASEDGLEGPYATLSHCWGTEYFLRLTATTVADFEAGVPCTVLPLTFQHTITTVKALGIWYLWIDCYCIIQGTDEESQKDWAREVDKMRDVYSHSLINIGAAMTDNPFGGMFRERELHLNRACFVRWKPTNEETERTWRLTDFHSSSGGHCYGAFQDLQRRTLMQRAWVIQETTLSNRMITFTDEGLMWQCNWTAATEDFPLQMSDCLVGWKTALPFWTMIDVATVIRVPELCRELKRIPGSALDGTVQESEFPTLIERWYRTLHAYRRARLTFPEKDIFPAIDGIAHLLSSRMRDPYQHGVFSRSLIEGLIWSAKERYGYDPCRNTNIPGIPSWHWASYEGGVDFSSCEYLYRKERENHSCVAPFVYMFMADDCTTLAELHAQDLWPDLLCIGKLLAIDQASSREIFTGVEHPYFSSPEPKLAGSEGRLSVELDTDEWRQSLEVEYTFLPILWTYYTPRSRSRYREESKVDRHVQGLVLRKSGHGRYMRVGIGEGPNCEQGEMMEMYKNEKPELIILE